MKFSMLVPWLPLSCLVCGLAFGEEKLQTKYVSGPPPKIQDGVTSIAVLDDYVYVADVVRVLRITQGAPAVEAVALSCQGVLEALRGRVDAARRMIASAREMVEELGITQRLRELDVFAGLVDLYEGDFAAAERSLELLAAGSKGGEGVRPFEPLEVSSLVLSFAQQPHDAPALFDAIAGWALRAAQGTRWGCTSWKPWAAHRWPSSVRAPTTPPCGFLASSKATIPRGASRTVPPFR